MRRIAWGIVILMFLAGSLFLAGCGPKEEADLGDAFPKTDLAEDEGGDE